MLYFNPNTQGIHDDEKEREIPTGSIAITPVERLQIITSIADGKRVDVVNGAIRIVEPTDYVPTAEALCQRIDTAADNARRAVAGDPLRAVEYDRARLAAEQFAAAGYEGEVPAMVAAWAINGRTPQQAADSILAEAAAYTNALELLRTTRLAAKEQIRVLMAANQVEQAQQLTDQTIAAIEAAVAGIGNNA